mmetsp:Transcript_118323/g.235693  ORF Transcript_118323/g.235693 Transcript_118323/m.235693 type:complete len:90 (+) Transcript_118323:180-449(+)
MSRLTSEMVIAVLNFRTSSAFATIRKLCNQFRAFMEIMVGRFFRCCNDQEVVHEKTDPSQLAGGSDMRPLFQTLQLMPVTDFISCEQAC